jgi:hypothetical protein
VNDIQNILGDEDKKQKINGAELIIAFLFPMLAGKCLILYFGCNYSEYPGQGYGVGLALSITFTVCMFARLLWKYRNYKD